MPFNKLHNSKFLGTLTIGTNFTTPSSLKTSTIGTHFTTPSFLKPQLAEPSLQRQVPEKRQLLGSKHSYENLSN